MQAASDDPQPRQRQPLHAPCRRRDGNISLDDRFRSMRRRSTSRGFSVGVTHSVRRFRSFIPTRSYGTPPLQSLFPHHLGGRLTRRLVPFRSIRLRVTHALQKLRKSWHIRYILPMRRTLAIPPCGLTAFVALRQDVWSRYTGGSGAPTCTLEHVGFDLSALLSSRSSALCGRPATSV